MLLPVTIFKSSFKTAVMLLFLFSAINLKAQSTKADTCKVICEEQVKTEKVPEANEVKKPNQKCGKKKITSKNKRTKRMEDGFLFKRHSISKL